MPNELMTTFEKLWVALRAQWCDNHDLNGALAFSHDRALMDFFHRVVQVNVDDSQVDRLIDDAIRLFQEKKIRLHVHPCATRPAPLILASGWKDAVSQKGC